MSAAPIEIVRDHQAHALLIFRAGRTKLHALALHQPPVRVVRLDKAERRHFTALEFKGKPYPLPRAVRAFRKAGRAFGITKGARTVLANLTKRDSAP